MIASPGTNQGFFFALGRLQTMQRVNKMLGKEKKGTLLVVVRFVVT